VAEVGKTAILIYSMMMPLSGIVTLNSVSCDTGIVPIGDVSKNAALESELEKSSITDSKDLPFS